MHPIARFACLLLSAVLPFASTADETRFGVEDIVRLSSVSAPDFSPDGEYLIYSVEAPNVEADEPRSDLWRVRWKDGEREQLTQTAVASEMQPLYSPDGLQIAFLSDQEVKKVEKKDEKKEAPEQPGKEDAPPRLMQVWVMPAAAADGRKKSEPQKLTDIPGGVSDFAWSPDGKRLAIIASDPELPAGEKKPPKPKPIVIDRYRFKEDFKGILTNRRQHLYLFDIATKEATLLTPGSHDEYLPAWSPDGTRIAYVTRRGGDPDRHANWDIYVMEAREGAAEQQVTRFEGADLDPSWESHMSWSPDGQQIAYLVSGEDKYIYYKPWQLAVVDVQTGVSRIPADIDRNFTQPRFSADGASVYALVEQSRVTNLSRIDVADGRVTQLTPSRRVDAGFDIAADGRIAVLGGDDHHPYQIDALEETRLRTLADHNEFLRDRRLAPVEPIEFESADGTRIHGLLVKPLDYQPGRRFPTILRLHGGPVSQFAHEFMADWQVYAAAGYAVVGPNPRGSSGRGFAYSNAIYADWGNKDTADVLAAVDHVIKLGVADPARLGVGGRSYGGILTNAVIATDQRFKAAVSGAGVSNVLATYGYDQYTLEYELELGLPWRDRAVYDRVSFPFFHADRIKTPTLFYCEELDVNVPCLGSQQMYQALRSLEVPTQLVIYPGEWHPVTVPSYLRDRMRRHLDWYGLYLGVVSRP
jgi:dipeptidyl aminopeptidase/acylaminoacyl peptidase